MAMEDLLLGYMEGHTAAATMLRHKKTARAHEWRRLCFIEGLCCCDAYGVTRMMILALASELPVVFITVMG